MTRMRRLHKWPCIAFIAIMNVLMIDYVIHLEINHLDLSAIRIRLGYQSVC